MNKTKHIIIIGWNNFAKQISEQIIIAGKEVIVISDIKIDINPFDNQEYNKQLNVIYTEFNDFEKINEANVESALAILINLESDTEKLKYVIQFNKYFSNKQTVVPINDANLKGTFYNAGVRYPLSNNEIAAKIISSFLFERDVAVYFEDLIASAESEDDYDIQQYLVLEKNPYCNVNYGDAFVELREKYNAVLIGLAKPSEKQRLLKNPPNNTVICEGDYLILILNGDTSDLLEEVFMIEEGAVL